MPLRRFSSTPFGFLWIGLALTFSASASTPAATPRTPPIRIMAAGDSITEGAPTFSTYRVPLAQKLHDAGYAVTFVGTRSSDSPLGPLLHEGYGGKNTESLLTLIPPHFREHPADIILLHSGHNHSVEETPIPGILAATEKLIAAFRAVNPRVTVLLAQVIPAGKLPKYAYLPDLNVALAQLAQCLDTPEQRVIVVDQASGFDWHHDTITDFVHPNGAGAEKIASAWFVALQKILPAPHPTPTAQR